MSGLADEIVSTAQKTISATGLTGPQPEGSILVNLNGKVLLRNGSETAKIWPNAQVTIDNDSGVFAVTNADGVYNFYDIPKGAHKITASVTDPACTPVSQTVDVSDAPNPKLLPDMTIVCSAGDSVGTDDSTNGDSSGDSNTDNNANGGLTNSSLPPADVCTKINTLYGTVVDPAGKSLAGVKVTLFNNPSDKITDSSGKFFFDNVKNPTSASNKITASLKGYRTTVLELSQWQSWPDGKWPVPSCISKTLIPIVMTPGLSSLDVFNLRGRVIDETTKSPVSNAEITITGSGVSKSVVANDNGYYEIADIKLINSISGKADSRFYNLCFSRNGYASRYRTLGDVGYATNGSIVKNFVIENKEYTLPDFALSQNIPVYRLYGEMRYDDGTLFDGSVALYTKTSSEHLTDISTSASWLSTDGIKDSHNYYKDDIFNARMSDPEELQSKKEAIEDGVIILEINSTKAKEYKQKYEIALPDPRTPDIKFNLLLHKNAVESFNVTGLVTNADHKPIQDVEIKIIDKSDRPVFSDRYTNSRQKSKKSTLDNKESNYSILEIDYSGKAQYVAYVKYLANNGEQKILNYNILEADLKPSTLIHKKYFYRLDIELADGLTDLEFNILDQKSGSGIQGASINLSGSDCELINIGGSTDASGKFALSFDDTMNVVDNLKGKLCKFGQTRISVTKKGYKTQIMQLDRISDFFTEYHSGKIYIMLLVDTAPKGSQVMGSTKDGNGKNVAGTIVTICPASNSGCVSPQYVTSGTGQYHFNLSRMSKGKYLLRAFNLNYLNSGRSLVYFDYNGESNFRIDLYLGDKIADLGVEFNPILLDRDTKSIIKGSINSSPGATNIGSDIKLVLKKNIEYTITATADGYEDQTFKTMIPSNFDSLSIQRREALSCKIIYLQKRDKGKVLDKLTIKVIDRSSSKPINSAVVTLNINKQTYDDLALDYNNLPSKAYAVTNAEGKTVLPDNLTYVNDSGDVVSAANPIRTGLKFRAGDYLFLKVEAAGYKYDYVTDLRVKDSGDEYIIKLEPENVAKSLILNTDEDSIFKNFDIEYFQSTIDLDSIRDEIPFKIKKKNGNNWQDVTNDGKFSVDVKLLWYPKTEGDYQVIYTDPKGREYKSGIVSFDGSKKVEVEFYNCTELALSPEYTLANYSDDIKILVVGKDLVSDYFNMSKRDIFDTAARALQRSKNSLYDVGKVLLVFNDDEEVNAYAFSSKANCFDTDLYSIISIQKGLISAVQDGMVKKSDLEKTTAHEYGHLIYSELERQKSGFIVSWDRLYRDISWSMMQYEIFTLIKDGNVMDSYVRLWGHPASNSSEMLASFYSGYLDSHQRLYGIIENNTKSQTRNVLEYMWQLFAENIGKVEPNDADYFKPVGGTLAGTEYTFDQIKSGVWKESVYYGSKIATQVNVQYSRLVAPVLASIKTSFSDLTGRVKTVPQTVISSIKSAVVSFNKYTISLLDSFYGRKYLVGDTDMSGATNNRDVAKIKRIISGLEAKPADICVYDLDNNGKINNNDLTELSKVISGTVAKPSRTCLVKIPWKKGNIKVTLGDKRGLAVSNYIIKIGNQASYIEPNTTAVTVSNVAAGNQPIEVYDIAGNSVLVASPQTKQVNVLDNRTINLKVQLGI